MGTTLELTTRQITYLTKLFVAGVSTKTFSMLYALTANRPSVSIIWRLPYRECVAGTHRSLSYLNLSMYPTKSGVSTPSELYSVSLEVLYNYNEKLVFTETSHYTMCYKKNDEVMDKVMYINTPIPEGSIQLHVYKSFSR